MDEQTNKNLWVMIKTPKRKRIEDYNALTIRDDIILLFKKNDLGKYMGFGCEDYSFDFNFKVKNYKKARGKIIYYIKQMYPETKFIIEKNFNAAVEKMKKKLWI